MGVDMRGDRLLRLNKKERFRYLNTELGIPQSLICEIHGLRDKCKRLLAAMQTAARYEDKPLRAVVLMLAGYSGVSPVAHYFGSYHNLRVKAGLYRGNASTCPWPGVKFSQADLRRNIRIPSTITKEVAELIGIHIGDGHQHVLNDSYVIEITSNHTSEKLYIDQHVVPLYEQVYGLKPIPNRISEKKNAYGFRIKSKAIFTFQKSIGLPAGRKTHVKIPELIMKSEKLRVACLRGIADTDFGITYGKGGSGKYHPVIIANFSSQVLVKQIEMILKNLGFRVSTIYDCKSGKYCFHSLRLRGFDNLHRWVKLIGFNNPKHLTKYLFWENYKESQNQELIGLAVTAAGKLRHSFRTPKISLPAIRAVLICESYGEPRDAASPLE